jgi:hypothetical protein
MLMLSLFSPVDDHDLHGPSYTTDLTEVNDYDLHGEWHVHYPKPVRTGMGTNVEQWRPLVESYFGDRTPTAMCLIAAESGGNENAYNTSSGASGLFQHLPKYWAERSAKAGWSGADIFNPTANVAVAAWLQRTDGWSHWSPWLRGACRN